MTIKHELCIIQPIMGVLPMNIYSYGHNPIFSTKYTIELCKLLPINLQLSYEKNIALFKMPLQ